MRKVIASTFVSLDGVLQAPGAPEEDRSGGFRHGGWTVPWFGEDMELQAAGFDAAGRELLLGRRTYEIFEAHWPHQPADDPTAKSLNAARKHVASRTLKRLEWQNSTLLGDDVPAAVRALKASAGRDLQIIGSGDLLRTLEAEGLVDEYNVWTFPVLLGRGKRLFDEALAPCALRLLDSKVSSSGVVMSRYVPDGPVRTGSFASEAPSAKELARRVSIVDER